MIKIEETQVVGFEPAIRGMRNPMNSWNKSDSGWDGDLMPTASGIAVEFNTEEVYLVGPNDLDLMTRLANGGPVHAKYARMLNVYVDITAPLYWWKEFDTYKVGTVANSCSTMHKIQAKEFTIDDFSHEHLSCYGASTRGLKGGNLMDETVAEFMFDYTGVLLATIVALNSAREQFLKREDKQYWWQMIQLLPSSYNQKRTVMLSYEVLAGIFKWRRNHKLNEWREFCEWIISLPLSELITRDEKGDI